MAIASSAIPEQRIGMRRRRKETDKSGEDGEQHHPRFHQREELG
jgi:hypothetical protein